jgi:hypothetical protein
LGTGCFKLLLNREEVKNAKYVPDLHINIQGENEFITQMEIEDSSELGQQTPMNPRTPGPNYLDTPGRSYSPYVDSGMGGFTPTAGFHSPGYMPQISSYQQEKDVVKPVNIFSPTYFNCK